MTPLISIVTPCFNCGKFIAETIESVQAQTYQNWEMIIIDDCSEDDSVAIARRYAAKDSRIKVNVCKNNYGAALARNIAIEMSRGEYLAFLDADDLWVPTKLEKQLRFMQENDCDFSCTEFEHMNEEGRSLGRQCKVPSRLSYTKMLFFNWAGCLTVMYKQDLNNKIYSDNTRQFNDYSLILQVIKRCHNAMGIHECLAAYRKRKASISRARKTKYFSLRRVLHNFEGHSLPIVWLCFMTRVFIKLFIQFRRITPQESIVESTSRKSLNL